MRVLVLEHRDDDGHADAFIGEDDVNNRVPFILCLGDDGVDNKLKSVH